MKTGKKLLALLLAVVMTMSMMTVGAFAEEPVDETQNSVEEPQTPAPETPAETEAPSLSTDIGEKTFIVGQTTEFTFTTTKGNYAGGKVYGISNFSDTEGNEAAVTTLEFKQGEQWINMKGQSFGGGEGFPLTDATSTFRVAFNKAGTYTFTAYMMPVEETDYAKAVCSTEVTFEVKETPKVAQVGEEQFETLQEAVNAAEKAAETSSEVVEIKLLDNIETADAVTFDQSGKYLLNLNDCTYTCTNDSDVIMVKAGDLDLQIVNGTIKGTGEETYGLYVYHNKAENKGYDHVNVTLDGVTMDVTDQTLGVQGNNTDNNLTVRNSTIKSRTLAIYFPPKSGKLVIENSDITAPTGVTIKGGSVEIGGNQTKITGYGEKVVPEEYYQGSGDLVTTGDAIYVESGYNDRDISVAITGGTVESKNSLAVQMFIKKGEAADVKREIAISGGTFSSKIDEKYLADGYVQNANGEVGELEQVAVAEVTTADGQTTKYETLQKAFNNVAENGTVTLLRDVTETDKCVVKNGRTFALDLGSKTLTLNKRLIVQSGFVTVKNGTLAGDVELSAGEEDKPYNSFTLAADAVIRTDGWGIMIFQNGKTGGANNFGTTVNVNGKIYGKESALWVLGNIHTDLGTAKNPVTVNVGSTAVMENNSPETTALQMAGSCDVTIADGAQITADTAVEVRAGRLTVNGGTITGTGTPTTVNSNGNGTSTTGVGIAVAQHTTALPISVVVNGGKISGYTGFYVTNPENRGNADKVQATINGGSFAAINGGKNAVAKDVNAEEMKLSVTGGYFTSDPGAYVADGHYVVDSDKTGYSYMVTDKAPVEAPVIVTETVEATVSDSLGADKETVSNLLRSNPPAVSGVADALTESGEDAILNAAGVTEAEKENADNLIKIEIEAKVEAVQADLGNEELTFEVTPVATVTINGTSKGNEVPVDNSYLGGQGITVKLPVPENFDVQEIKHTSDTKGVEYFLKTGNKTFDVKDGYVELTIRHFSKLKLSGSVTAAAMVDGTAYPTLQDAINAAGNGDTITVLAGIDPTEKVTVSGKSLTIELGSTGYSADNIATGSRTEKVVTGTTVKITYSAPSSGGGSSSSSGRYTVKVDSGKHGEVKVSSKRADKGDTITITVDPDKGYVLDELTVTDKDGDTVKVKSKSDTKFTFTMPASDVTVEATFTAEKEETLPFADIPEDFWAVKEITWAYGKGYMNGVSADQFAPGRTVTRQQLWMVLARLAGEKPADMTAARQWAVENGVSDGSNPGGALTRQQMVTILYRYAKLMGYNAAGSADLTVFPDHASVADYAKEAMAWSVKNEIVGGTAQGTLNPAGTANRAQFAVILYRFCGNVL